MRKKRISEEKRKMVATTKERYGEDFFKNIAGRSFKDTSLARRASIKYHYPEALREDGTIDEDKLRELKEARNA